MEHLYLNQLLNFRPDEMDKIKVRFILQPSGSKEDPLELYCNDPEKINTGWFLGRRDKNLLHEGEIAIALLRMNDSNRWLLTTIKRIVKEYGLKSKEDGIVNYEATELPEFAPYYGRTIVHFHKTSQAPTRWYKSIYEQLVVDKILSSSFTGDEFPGYDNVRISWRQLERIVNHCPSDWINALKNQKAVYLITDKKNGHLYVGSATGEDMLLERWTAYIKTGHGGNTELKELDFEYIQENFQYSILENYNARVDDSVVLARETWWKETLQSRKFGYNGN